MQVKLAAYSLLKDGDDLKLKPHFPQDYLPTFDFEVITVDVTGKENSRRKSFARFFPEDLGNSIALEMVYIPGGTFTMGSPDSEQGRYDSQSPSIESQYRHFLPENTPSPKHSGKQSWETTHRISKVKNVL